ncbi:hypothetical protein [Leucothrix arctica]|uniref:Coiled coil domain-containing protein n=1 Tax=Leucothrix arctica TaxID=1481894 RepID=A0A317C5C0_9GAMM|nr:hypothetical protein [Leucothrix arctica]PWQ93826.1 hypothetical protein DKT75_19685 [Leucothrix arctica]
MNTKEDYQQKIQAELELTQVKITELKARAKLASADERVSYKEHIHDMEQKLATTKTKLKVFSEAGDEAWEELKSGVDTAWKSFSASVQKASDKFKT